MNFNSFIYCQTIVNYHYSEDIDFTCMNLIYVTIINFNSFMVPQYLGVVFLIQF